MPSDSFNEINLHFNLHKTYAALYTFYGGVSFATRLVATYIFALYDVEQIEVIEYS